MSSSNGMPSQKISSYPLGASSPASAAIIKSNNNAMLLNSLNGNKPVTGGNGNINVPPVSSSAPNKSMTESNYKDLTKLASSSQENAKYDSQVGGLKHKRRHRKKSSKHHHSKSRRNKLTKKQQKNRKNHRRSKRHH